MANIISDETIEYVGILAKLELNEEEKEQAKKDMEKINIRYHDLKQQYSRATDEERARLEKRWTA